MPKYIDFILDYIVFRNGRVLSLKSDKFLKPTKNNCHMGYPKVTLYYKGKRKTYLLHRLVWEYFNGKIPSGMQVDHIDGNVNNNSIYNLQLLTQKQNIRKRPYTKLTVSQEKDLYKEYARSHRPYGFVTKLGNKYGVSRHVVNKIVKKYDVDVQIGNDYPEIH